MKTVALFIPCFIDTIYPDVALATAKLLKSQGYKVVYPKEQTCCGQPLFNSGYRDEARELALRFYDIFHNFDYIVAPSASCISMVKIHYKDLLPKEKFLKLQKKSYEIVEFLHDIVEFNSSDISFAHSVALHKSCHGLRELNLSTPKELNLPYQNKIENLLKDIKNIEIKEMKRDEECCGFGGTFSINENEISVKMAHDKIANFENSQAEYFLGYDCSCMMHLKSVSDFEKKDIKYLHIVEILAGLKS